MYSLRHAFASHLMMRGVDLMTVSRLFGRAAIQITMCCSHLRLEHQAKAVGVLDNVLGYKNSKIDTKWSQEEVFLK